MVYALRAKPIHGHYPKVDWGEGNMPSAKFIEVPSDGLPKIGPQKAGVPVDGSMLPKKIFWDEDPSEPPADFDKTPRMNISERAKAVIEAVEPDAHQFFAVGYVGRDGVNIETRYWLYICNRRDAIHPTKSNMVLDRHGRYRDPMLASDLGLDIPDHANPDAPAKFVIDETKINGAHLWREARADGLPLMSEAMYQAFVVAGLTGFVPSEKLEVTGGTPRRAFV